MNQKINIESKKYRIFSWVLLLAYILFLFFMFPYFGMVLLIPSVIPVLIISWYNHIKYGVLAQLLVLLLIPILSVFYSMPLSSFLKIAFILGIAVSMLSIVFIYLVKNVNLNLLKSRNQIELNGLRQENMISNISDVISIVDKNGLIVFKSKNIKDHFGWEPHELIGKAAWTTVHPDDLDQIKVAFMELLSQPNSNKKVQFRYCCKDGHYKTVLLFANNLIHNPSINGILLNYHNISEHNLLIQNLKASENKYRSLFENMQEIVCMLDKDGNIMDINEAGCRFYEYNKDELLKMHVSQLIYQEDKATSDEYFEKLEKEGFYEMYEGRSITKSGKIKWIQVNSTEFFIDGQKIGSQDIIRDISFRKEFEQELFNKNKVLNEAVASKDKFRQ